MRSSSGNLALEAIQLLAATAKDDNGRLVVTLLLRTENTYNALLNITYML